MTKTSLALGVWFVLAPPLHLFAEPPAAALAAFETYSKAVGSRIDERHRSTDAFLAPADTTRLRHGDLIVEQLTPKRGGALAGALLHHWRGTAFAPGGKAEDFEHLLRDFSSYPRNFSPQVIDAKVLNQNGDRDLVKIRVCQQHVVTVVLDTTYDVTFGRLDPHRGYSTSQSTRIAEVEQAGTGTERALSPAEEHGYLWRLNTWWSFEERDGGLVLQIEAVSLTRTVPRLLDWAIRGYVESIPRESLEFTLRAGRNALKGSKS